MQADAKRRQAARARDSIIGGWCAEHQARRRENSLTVSRLNGLVDGKRESKIVGGDDQPLCFGRRHFNHHQNFAWPTSGAKAKRRPRAPTGASPYRFSTGPCTSA